MGRLRGRCQSQPVVSAVSRSWLAKLDKSPDRRQREVRVNRQALSRPTRHSSLRNVRRLPALAPFLLFESGGSTVFRGSWGPIQYRPDMESERDTQTDARRWVEGAWRMRKLTIWLEGIIGLPAMIAGFLLWTN
jgi:hypothetical protein